jgi:SAM-dependent methyltransferase
MDFKQIFYPESRFGGYTDIDGTVVFYSRVQSLVTAESVVLDVGCGRGACAEDPIALRRELRIFKGKAKRVIGIDLDEAAASNPFLDEFHLLNDAQWPVEAGSVDVIVCDNVIEHVEDPEAFFTQARRALRANGVICVRTPNSWGYVALCSRLVPNRHHARVLGKVQDGRKEEDVFPTLYRCNSIWAMRAMLRRHGFDHSVYGYEAEPSYLSFSRLAYWLGVWHQRLAPRFLKPALFAFGRVKT